MSPLAGARVGIVSLWPDESGTATLANNYQCGLPMISSCNGLKPEGGPQGEPSFCAGTGRAEVVIDDPGGPCSNSNAQPPGRALLTTED